MRTSARTHAVAGLLAGALVLTGCGSGDDPTVAGGDDSSATAGQTQFNDGDVAFVSGMVPHHEQAVEMADMILRKDPSEPVRALAERIQAAQQPEIEELDALLKTFGKESASGGHGGHGGGSEAATHGGMMTDAQMQDLHDAMGVEAERTFLTMMIEHHRGAIEAAETVIADGENRAVIDLATRIRDDQRAEIAEMEQLLTSG
ncbi:MAG TPA: DUF305 domain-containing protein [Mycobacteriales bacterium]|nr:DUF305 domain-containing protein [Mycobacteriales bacterium]